VLSVVVATPDVVGERMAGPGIRAWHLARELEKHFPTTLVSKGSGAQASLRTADVLIGQPARGFRRFRKRQRIIFDLFDPVLLELRELYGKHPTLRQRVHYAAESHRVRHAVRTGDLLIVATTKQRELYKSTRIIEVPFGTESSDAALAGDRERDDLIVWGGGTWEWLDPALAVDAIVHLNHEGVACRLLFLGRTRPNLRNRLREEAFDELIARGAPWVTANDEWVPYSDRLSWLQRAKIAMMLHRPTPEAAYSIRTRLFDAMAAAVPVITTEEGFAAELVSSEGLGLVVPPSDRDAVAAAVRRLLRDDEFHASCVKNIERIRPRFTWEAVTQPLVESIRQWQKQL
jgi:glycosyltransferase involved in cell wall biosynthesis